MLRRKINKPFVRYPKFGGNGHLEGEEGARTAKGVGDVPRNCDTYERYLRLDGLVPPMEGMTAGHAFARSCCGGGDGIALFGMHVDLKKTTERSIAGICNNKKTEIEMAMIAIRFDGQAQLLSC